MCSAMELDAKPIFPERAIFDASQKAPSGKRPTLPGSWSNSWKTGVAVSKTFLFETHKFSDFQGIGPGYVGTHGVATGDRNRAPNAIMGIVNTTAPATQSDASVTSIPVDPHCSCAQPLR